MFYAPAPPFTSLVTVRHIRQLRHGLGHIEVTGIVNRPLHARHPGPARGLVAVITAASSAGERGGERAERFSLCENANGIIFKTKLLKRGGKKRIGNKERRCSPKEPAGGRYSRGD
jgi:hypothetical protein